MVFLYPVTALPAGTGAFINKGVVGAAYSALFLAVKMDPTGNAGSRESWIDSTTNCSESIRTDVSLVNPLQGPPTTTVVKSVLLAVVQEERGGWFLFATSLGTSTYTFGENKSSGELLNRNNGNREPSGSPFV